jgi:hypothetical protein
MMGRQFWVVAHRWAGLTLALFLAVAGFTGIFLSWIDGGGGHRAPPATGRPALAGRSSLSTLESRRRVSPAIPARGLITSPWRSSKAIPFAFT